MSLISLNLSIKLPTTIKELDTIDNISTEATIHHFSILDQDMTTKMEEKPMNISISLNFNTPVCNTATSNSTASFIKSFKKLPTPPKFDSLRDPKFYKPLPKTQSNPSSPLIKPVQNRRDSCFDLDVTNRLIGPKKFIQEDTFTDISESDELSLDKSLRSNNLKIRPTSSFTSFNTTGKMGMKKGLKSIFKESSQLLKSDDSQEFLERFFNHDDKMESVQSQPNTLLLSPAIIVPRSHSEELVRSESENSFTNENEVNKAASINVVPTKTHKKNKSEVEYTHPAMTLIHKIKNRKAITTYSFQNKHEIQMENIINQVELDNQIGQVNFNQLSCLPWFIKLNKSSDDLASMPNKMEGHISKEISPTPSCRSSEYNESLVSSPVDPVEERSFKQFRMHIIMELIDTEKSFLQSMRMILDLFYHPLLKNTNKFNLDNNELTIIFGKIEPLIQLSQELWSSLDFIIQSEEDPSISHVFLNREDKFNMFLDYVNKYIQAMNIIQKCEDQSSKFTEFLSQQQQLTSNRQGLKDLLILPIQRLTRYTLLLQSLRRKTSSQHPDYEGLTSVIDFMTSIAIEANETERNEQEKLVALNIYNQVDQCPTMLKNIGFKQVLVSEGMEIKLKRKIKMFLYPNFIMLALSRKTWTINNKFRFLRLSNLKDIKFLEVVHNYSKLNIAILVCNNDKNDQLKIKNNIDTFIIQHSDLRAHQEFAHVIRCHLKNLST